MSDRDVWRQVVACADARIDQGLALAGTELEHALRRWPDGYERELPSLWLLLHPGTGARHPALEFLEVAPLTRAAAVERTLDCLDESSSEHELGWAAACLTLARSPAALVVPRLAARLAHASVRLVDGRSGSIDERPIQRLCLLAAQLRDADESKELVLELVELLTAADTPSTRSLASLATIEIGRSVADARSQIESLIHAESFASIHAARRGPLCEIAACIGVELTTQQQALCAAYSRPSGPEREAAREHLIHPSLCFADRLLAERAALAGLRERARNKRIVELAASIFVKPRPGYQGTSESLRIEALRYTDGASGFGLARIQAALDDPSARVRMRALVRLREFGSRGSVAVEQVLELVRSSSLWWERIAALRCLPAIIDDERRTRVGESLIAAVPHARTPDERDELEVIGDMILSGWRP